MKKILACTEQVGLMSPLGNSQAGAVGIPVIGASYLSAAAFVFSCTVTAKTLAAKAAAQSSKEVSRVANLLSFILMELNQISAHESH